MAGQERTNRFRDRLRCASKRHLVVDLALGGIPCRRPLTIVVGMSIDLLGGAERHATRVRGFVPWPPRDATLAVLD
jgi:hypothetical protein